MGAAQALSVAEDAHLLTAAEVLGYIRTGDLTVEQYVRALLDRIAERDSQVRAWAYLDRDYVLEQARALDAVPLEQRGPLHGMPIGVKDVIYTKDMPTQFNSSAYKGNFPKVDAAPITLLRAAGALLLGKTTTTEFAATGEGPATRNPHDLSRTPGGSSSGSGASVGDFQVPVALGTQTGGSVIRPASFNGTYGFKPTWGRISREGLKFFSVTYDTLGFFTRGIDDLVLLADAFGLHDDSSLPASARLSSLDSVDGLRLALFRTMMWPHAGPGTRAAVDDAVALLRARGATVEDVELPAEFDQLPAWYDVVLAVEGGTAFLPEYRANRAHLGALLVGYAETSGGYSHRAYLEAVDGIAALRPKMDAVLAGYDAVLTPSTPDEAPIGSTTGSYLFCKVWSALHVPVLNMPGFQGAHGMPIGLSLVAPRFKDAQLLAVAAPVAAIFEAEGGWTRRVHNKTVTMTNGHYNGAVDKTETNGASHNGMNHE
ncbi:glutamyl-tRNA(Gln) amidotransferase subunit A [Akanthomyces lecanii RCEF 1005]|uniref:Glutamyl-tRNA(Gln) amidotransferase subunit A n=1 Tax=Akanthomyces lecanii RCEF 1005 TaxID=1081108 RepID=A0A168HXN7_CORDF|nr:glutamyl-tRNA(Gln) amidotransferase subunit A [Akanthomyces lecanii RCEF 1005]